MFRFDVYEKDHRAAARADCGSPSALSAPVALPENAERECEIAFRRDSFMLFSDVLDPVARVARIAVRGRNEMTNFVGARGR